MGSVAGGLHALIVAHHEALYRYAYRLTGSSADAEDLTQEAYGKAFVRLGQLRESDRAKAWLFRILRNLYLHKIRDEKRHRVVSLDAVGDLPGREAEESPDIDPAKLQMALDELEEGFRTPLILFYFEEFSYRDIAEQMDLPIGTVMSRLARAKAYLRVKLSQNGPGSEELAGGKSAAHDGQDRTDRTDATDATDGKVGRNSPKPKEVSDAVP